MSPKHTTDQLTAPMFQVLLSMLDADLHGYAIIQDVEARTGGTMRLTASTLYGVLKRLLDAGYIAERRGVDPVDARRRVYGITRSGRAAAAAEVDRLAELLAAARSKNLRPSLRRS